MIGRGDGALPPGTLTTVPPKRSRLVPVLPVLVGVFALGLTSGSASASAPSAVFNRAASSARKRLYDRSRSGLRFKLEDRRDGLLHGLVGPARSAKDREVLIDPM